MAGEQGQLDKTFFLILSHTNVTEKFFQMALNAGPGWLAINPFTTPATTTLTSILTSPNIVDMDMHMGMDMGVMPQRPYIHFGTQDPLWFQAWSPTSSGAIVGACIGLALLAMFSRLLVGIRGVLEAEWRRR